MKARLVILFVILMAAQADVTAQYPNWFPVEGKLMTQWSAGIDPGRIHQDYPRPGLKRNRWLNLNGLWEFALTGRDTAERPAYHRQILVPFSVESAMSGIGTRVDSSRLIWYRKSFILPDDWSNHMVVLHFGGSDWETTVYVNGQKVGLHRGGYDPFSFDISYYLREQGAQQIEVSVWDPTDQFFQPRGKQSGNPSGIWYTPVSGIWQTVWLEPVPVTHIRSVRISPDFDAQQVKIEADLHKPEEGDSLHYRIGEENLTFVEGAVPYTAQFVISLPNPKVMVARSALSVRPPARSPAPGPVAGGGDLLLRNAQNSCGNRWKGHSENPVEQPARFHAGCARPGLVARRIVYRALIGRPGIRPPAT
jgi:hypothetical protein